MKLKKKGINNTLWDSLCKIQSDKRFDEYYLVGGTALSLLIEHRISVDIDLFTNTEIKKDEILDYLQGNIDKDIKIINNGIKLFQLYSDEKKLKIDFVQVPDKLIDPVIEAEGIRLAGLNDISAMKISATGTRGSEAKDFVDLYYLLKYMSIDKIFENFLVKSKTSDILHYVRSAMYFDDVKDSSWKAINFIHDKVSKTEVINKLTNEISNYQKRELQKKHVDSRF